MTIEVKKEMNFTELLEISWEGAKTFLYEVQDAGKEDELMQHLSEVFYDGPADMYELNDYLRFNDDSIREYIGMNKEDED